MKRSELARLYVPIIRSAVEDYRAARDERRLATHAGYAALLTLVLLLALWLIRFVVRRLDGFVARRYQRRLEGLKVGSLQLVRAERVRGAVRGVLRTLRAVLVLILLYVYLQRVLGASAFPPPPRSSEWDEGRRPGVGSARVIGSITEPNVIKRILDHRDRKRDSRAPPRIGSPMVRPPAASPARTPSPTA